MDELTHCCNRAQGCTGPSQIDVVPCTEVVSFTPYYGKTAFGLPALEYYPAPDGRDTVRGMYQFY